jgi:N-acetylmuramoyl-L-alanine amidase
MFVFKKIIVCFICLIFSSSLYANYVSDISIYNRSGAAQFVVTTSEAPRVSAFSLANPQRIVLDIKNIQHLRQAVIDKIATFKHELRAVRYSINDQHVLRLVLDLKQPAHAVVAVSNMGVRLNLQKITSVAARRRGSVVSYSHKQSADSRSHLITASSAPLTAKAATIPNARDIVVVVDPGHGGKDPGTTSRSGVHEKTVVLQIAKKLVADIDQHAGFTAKLTRTGDYYLTLRQRLALARKYKADMFIAVHADAFHDAKAHGVSVFALSLKGATSEAARWLANRENQSELVGGVKLDNKSNMLKSVLINLSQNSTIQSSLVFGEGIIKQVRGFAVLHHKSVEQAAFVVLKSPDIPSLLIETGFLSNRQEEKRLVSRPYQTKLAGAISQGIVNTFANSPPAHTLVAYWKKHPGEKVEHRVVNGDTLSQIAQRFNTSVRSLRTRNNLRSNTITVGSILVIR